MYDKPITVREMMRYYFKNTPSAAYTPFLTEFGANTYPDSSAYRFWDDYRNTAIKLDLRFSRMFSSFSYYLQNDVIEDYALSQDDYLSCLVTVITQLRNDVYDFLLLNAKKYEELYRIYVISDANDPLTVNYDITEILEKEKEGSDTNTYGREEDTDNYGQVQTTTNSTKGSQSDTRTSNIAGFNSNTYANDNQINDTFGSRVDSGTVTESQHSDTHIRGQRIDTLENIASESYTLTRQGNIGVKTVTEMLKEHKDFWTPYEFYSSIFKDISAELLCLDVQTGGD